MPENNVLITPAFTWYKQATSNSWRHGRQSLHKGAGAGYFYLLQAFSQSLKFKNAQLLALISRDWLFLYLLMALHLTLSKLQKPQAMLVTGKVANTINSARMPAAWPKLKHDTENDVMYHSYCYLFRLCTALTSLLQVRELCMFVTRGDLQIKWDYNWNCVLQWFYCKNKAKPNRTKQDGKLVVTVNHVLLTFQVKLITHSFISTTRTRPSTQ